MEYTVHELAALSGVSCRTLRYYDSIKLLSPDRIGENGYRYYGTNEIDRLQQILFYRELAVPLEQIAKIIDSPDFDREAALQSHLTALQQKKARIETLIDTVSVTIGALKGELSMTDQEKFKGLKQDYIRNNEAKYGKEIRERYSDKQIDASNAKIEAMDEQEWNEQQSLEKQIAELLKEVVACGDPDCEAAHKMCAYHKKWLCSFWGDGAYSTEAHRMLAEGYLEDGRFRAYYDAITPGGAQMIHDALFVFCSQS